MLELDDLRQLGQVTLHGEHTVDDNQFDCLVGQRLEDALQVFHVVVLVVKLLGKRKTTAIDNGSMVAVVSDDLVVLTADDGEHTLVHREACGEAEGLVLADVFCEVLLQLHVEVERSVEETAAGTT